MSAVATNADEAWSEGFDAFDNSRADTANPYDHGTDEHLSWNDGWLEAQRRFAGADPEAHSGI